MGPEFISNELVTWAESAGMAIQYINREPNQNAYIEKFNRTYRDEVLNFYLFESLAEVRETTYRWIIDYSEQRPHDAMGCNRQLNREDLVWYIIIYIV